MNGKLHLGDDLSSDLLNPFVHRLELATTYDKVKTAVFTVAVLPLRVLAIMVLLVLAWLLACVGLLGLSEEDLRTKPMTGWRKDTKSVVCLLMRGLFMAGGFHRVHVKGRQAAAKEAPVLALAPHSSYFDALPVVYLGAPSVVAKGETGYLPFFGKSLHLAMRLEKGPLPVTTLRGLICDLGRWSYQMGGMSLVVRGRQASRREAPILVIAPHSTFLDAGIVYVTGFPSIICRRESGTNPWLGKLINYTQPVYVWREDPMSRQNSIKEIIHRATSPLDWPQVLIFPEGTCTNRSCLITFKPGAFYPGMPVQPVCIRYPNKLDTVTWTWEGPGALKLLWLTLTQSHSSCEIEFLPVYHPSEEEKQNPKLFANNVRHLMAKALGVPVSDYTYNDCRLLSRVKQMKLPHATNLLEVQKLRTKLGLLTSGAEERLLRERAHGPPPVDWSRVTLEQFASCLAVKPSDPALQMLFQLYQKDKDEVDLREYLLGVLAISQASSTLEAVELAFQIYDASGVGRLSVQEMAEALLHSLAVTREDAYDMFRMVDRDGRGYVTFAEWESFARRRSELSHLFPSDSQADQPSLCPSMDAPEQRPKSKSH